MTHFAIPLSPIVVQSLGWTLLHFVWQGAALAAALCALLVCCRGASTRYALGVGALILLVAAPAITFLILLPRPHRSAAWMGVPPAAAAVNRAEATIATAPASQAAPQLRPHSDRLIWLVELWLVGVALFSLRATGGFFLIERIRRRGIRPVSCELLGMCQMLQRRLGIERAVRFCGTRLLPAPAVIGLFRPIVLLPVTALTGLSEAQLQAIIAHELAHIRRFDSFVNLFQVGAEALLFYHPAVWWVSRRIRIERENCCDDEAIRACGDAVGYARALTLLEERRSAPLLATGISTTPLTARVLRLLGLEEIRGGWRGGGFAMGLLCLAGALLAGHGFWGVAKASVVPPRQAGQPTGIRHRAGIVARSHVVYRYPFPRAEAAGAPAQAASQEATAKQQSVESASSTSQAGKQGFLEQMRAAGLKDLTVDQAIALKVQGVTPDYVRQMHALSFSFNAEELIALRVQGVTPEYVKEMRAAGLKLTADQLVGMKVQGITPEYVREMSGLGFQVDPDDLVGMRVQGVTPEYVKEMRATGLKLTADHLVAMRTQGVTPEYVKALQAAGLKNLASDDFIAAKIQGITPEFVEKARQHGFQNLSLDKLVQLKLAGVL